MVAVIVKNFCAGTAWARVTHHPKIIRRVTRALIVTNTNNAIRRYANLLIPNLISLIIFGIYRDQQLFLRQLKYLG